jgi:hypothetical protein
MYSKKSFKTESVMKTKSKLAVIFSVLFFVSVFFFNSGDAEEDVPKLIITKPMPPENYPCSKCHRYLPVNKAKRKLVGNHSNIVLKHAEDQQWCFNCHEGDKLKLANGQLIDYEKSYILCGQCHGTVIRDWKAGIHGKTTGMWDGEKVYRICVTCHDPHQPRFKPLEPKQPPMRPADIKLK